MSIWGRRPIGPTPSPKPSPRTIPKSAPVQKPGPFEGGGKASIKKMMQEAKKRPMVIPRTGGIKMWPKQYEKLLKERLPYKKVGTDLSKDEARRVLRQMRREDRGTPSRERRVLEEQWGLKSGKDY